LHPTLRGGNSHFRVGLTRALCNMAYMITISIYSTTTAYMITISTNNIIVAYIITISINSQRVNAFHKLV